MPIVHLNFEKFQADLDHELQGKIVGHHYLSFVPPLNFSRSQFLMFLRSMRYVVEFKRNTRNIFWQILLSDKQSTSIACPTKIATGFWNEVLYGT